MQKVKFPKIHHLPWSPGLTRDDKRIESVDAFLNQEVVVTLKCDGENANFSKEYFHARSLNEGALTAKQTWSREWVKNLWGKIRYNIPDNMKIVGENMYAYHSIEYNALPSYYLVFAILQDDLFLSWDETVEWCSLLDLVHVPVLYRGQWDEGKVKQCYGHPHYSKQQEGYVVRLADPFNAIHFDKKVAKYVRESHVKTDGMWIHGEWIKNKLAETRPLSCDEAARPTPVKKGSPIK